ncbi:hypothetical protein F5879DRAFT_998428 [Lentinula edodes]|nr:hypothetical protein F5879DRAFT_998428 [Lentinula edodes]
MARTAHACERCRRFKRRCFRPEGGLSCCSRCFEENKECIVTDRKRLGRKPRQPYSLKRTEPQKLIKPSSNSSLDQGHSTDGGDFRGSAIQWKPSPELRLHSVDLGKAISHENLASMQQLEHFWINPDPPPTPPAVSPRVQVASSYSNKYTEFAATTPAPPAVSPRVQVASSYSNKYTEFAATHLLRYRPGYK